jgi:hypothetical protein
MEIRRGKGTQRNFAADKEVKTPTVRRGSLAEEEGVNPRTP